MQPGNVTIADDGTVTGAGVGVAGLIWSALVANPAIAIPDHTNPPANFTSESILPIEVSTKRFFAALANSIAAGTAAAGAPRAAWRYFVSTPSTKYDEQGAFADFSLDDSGSGFEAFVNDGGTPITSVNAFAISVDSTNPTHEITAVTVSPYSFSVQHQTGVLSILVLVW